MNKPTNSEALPPTTGSPSSDTPRTDAFAQRLTDAKVPASKTWPHWYDHAAALEREVDRWKANFIPFAIIHAANYGRDHYGDLCLHFTHYDLLAEAGARMDDFKRCGAPSPQNAYSPDSP